MKAVGNGGGNRQEEGWAQMNGRGAMRMSLLGGLVGYERIFSIISTMPRVPQNPRSRFPQFPGSGPSDTSHHRRSRTTTLRVLLPFLQTGRVNGNSRVRKFATASKLGVAFFKQLGQYHLDRPDQLGTDLGNCFFKGGTSGLGRENKLPRGNQKR